MKTKLAYAVSISTGILLTGIFSTVCDTIPLILPIFPSLCLTGIRMYHTELKTIFRPKGESSHESKRYSNLS